MDATPYLQSVPALLVFGIVAYGLMKAHERAIDRLLTKHAKDQLDAMIIRAEVAQLRRMVMESDQSKAQLVDQHKPISLGIKVV